MAARLEHGWQLVLCEGARTGHHGGHLEQHLVGHRQPVYARGDEGLDLVREMAGRWRGDASEGGGEMPVGVAGRW